MPTMFGVPADVRPSSIPGATPERPVMVPPQRFGVKLVSMGFLVDTKTPMIWRGPMLASASMQLFKEVFWEELDYLVVDLPPGTGDIQLTIAQQVARGRCRNRIDPTRRRTRRRHSRESHV